MMIKNVNEYDSKIYDPKKTYGYTIKAGRSVDPWTRASRLGASLVWYTGWKKEDKDTANELELFWCASQYLKLAYSLFDFKRINCLKGKKKCSENLKRAKRHKNMLI